MEFAAAQALASAVKPDELAADYIIPSVFNRDVASSRGRCRRRRRRADRCCAPVTRPARKRPSRASAPLRRPRDAVTASSCRAGGARRHRRLAAERPANESSTHGATSGSRSACCRRRSASAARPSRRRGSVASTCATTLDGVQSGIEVLDRARAPTVFASSTAATRFMNAHDKLRTARLLVDADLPHPNRFTSRSPADATDACTPRRGEAPFRKLGRRCVPVRDRSRARTTLIESAPGPGSGSHGALIQELVPPVGYDVRLVAAGGVIVGAVELAHAQVVATNSRSAGRDGRLLPSREACALAVMAAASRRRLRRRRSPACRAGYVVLELNGAVEFDQTYDIGAARVRAAARHSSFRYSLSASGRRSARAGLRAPSPPNRERADDEDAGTTLQAAAPRASPTPHLCEEHAESHEEPSERPRTITPAI